VAAVIPPVAEILAPVADVFAPIEEVFPAVTGDVALQTIYPALKPLCELGIALTDGLIICILDALEGPSLDRVVALVEEVLPPVADVFAPIEEVFPPVASVLEAVEAVLPPVAPPLQALLLDLVDERRVFGIGLGQARGLLGGPAHRRQHQGHEGGQHQDDAAGAPDLVDTHGSPPFIESE
jgi:hypothetical protein